MKRQYFVRAEWDSDARVWVASSDDVPGLITEADTIEALDAKLQTIVPELLELNGCLPSCDSIEFEIGAQRV
jgi:predicted RNase H-like HicB family nuclease